MPRTRWRMRSPSLDISVRIPATLRGPPATSRRTSFGHLSLGARRSCDSVAASAAPARRVRGATFRAGRAGRSSREKVRFSPGRECQLRPRRPRPFVCSSATMSSPSPRPAVARTATSSLVDPQVGRCSTGWPSLVVRSVAVNLVAKSGSA